MNYYNNRIVGKKPGGLYTRKGFADRTHNF